MNVAGRMTVIFAACVLVVVGFVAHGWAGATGLVTYSAPSSAILSIDDGSGPPPPIRSGCSSLMLNAAQSMNPSVAGSPATLAYGCGIEGESPAFTTTQSHGAKKLTAIPIFSVPQGWGLELSQATGSGECTYRTIPLTSGTPVTLSSGTGYTYCLTTTDASSFLPFSVTWTQ